MKKLVSFIEKMINSLENAPFSFYQAIISFFSIIAIRIFIENYLTKLQNRAGIFLFYEISHTILFFLISFIFFVLILKIFLKTNFKKNTNIVLIGFLITLTPPIIDYIISGGSGFWSFYKFDGILGLIRRFFTFFGDNPEIGITYGVRIDIFISLIFLGFYTYFKSKKIITTLLTLATSYFALFVLGTFPSYVTIIIQGFSKGFFNITDINVAQMFLSPISLFSQKIPDIISSLNIKMSLIYAPVFSLLTLGILYFYAKNKLIVFWKLSRPKQLLYQLILFSFGTTLSFISNKESLFPLYSTFQIDNIFFHILGFLVLLESIACAWIASVFLFNTLNKPVCENPENTMTKYFYTLGGFIFFTSSLFLSAIVSLKITSILIAYQAILYIKSFLLFQFKNFRFISAFISSLASLIIVMAGYLLISPKASFNYFIFLVLIILFIVNFFYFSSRIPSSQT